MNINFTLLLLHFYVFFKQKFTIKTLFDKTWMKSAKSDENSLTCIEKNSLEKRKTSLKKKVNFAIVDWKTLFLQFLPI